MTSRFSGVSILALALSLSAGAALAQTAPQSPAPGTPPAPQPAQAGTVDPSGEPETHELETVEVTGSRLELGDPTTRTIVITAEDIRERGVTSAEELIRTLPQNLATIGAITNERLRGPLSNRTAPVSSIGSLGVSAANLGGMGAGNTLILVNGRRVAGAAGIEDGFANLNGIPLSAVERVEITLGGASAVYGADAIGGVINFVLKKDFRGSTLTMQHEFSSNEADNSRISLFSGTAWGSGSLSGSLDYSRRRPINNYESGYVTQDYSGYYNGEARFDTRSWSRGLQPGVIDRDTFMGNTLVREGLTLPRGFNGRPQISDFITVGAEALPDYVEELAGPDVETFSATINLEQRFTDRLTLFVNGLYTQATNEQDQLYSGLTVQLAPGQAYNPFPAFHFDPFTRSLTVNYNPAAEIAAGMLPQGRLSNETEQWNLNANLEYRIDDDTRLQLLYTTSESTSSGGFPGLSSVVVLTGDPTQPNGVRCYNGQLEGFGVLTPEARAELQARFDRQCVALTSADPALAFNPWKTDPNGPGVSVTEFYGEPLVQDRGSRTENWEARLNGALYTLPAGKVYYVVGAEMTADDTDSAEVRSRTLNPVTRDRRAYFGELTVPIFDEGFNFPGFHSLLVNFAVRRDSYSVDGPIGTVDNIPFDSGGVPIFATNEFANTTPAVGLRWEPIRGLALRARWTEGFQAPPYTQLFAPQSVEFLFPISNDPYYTCTTDCSRPGRQTYLVPSRQAPNPDLEPQTSTQYTYGLNWQPGGWLNGLQLDITYNQTTIEGQFAQTLDLFRLMPAAQVYRLTQFYPRDPVTNKILEYRNMTFNIAGSEYASVNYELSYQWPTSWGTFTPRLNVLDNLTAERQALLETPPVSTIGLTQGPDDYRVVGSLGWFYQDVSASLWAYYTPEYINDYEVEINGGVVRDPARFVPVDDMLMIDLTASYQLSETVRLSFAGRNILDEAPPFVVVGGRPYDTARYNAAGRTLSFEMQYSF